MTLTVYDNIYYGNFQHGLNNFLEIRKKICFYCKIARLKTRIQLIEQKNLTSTELVWGKVLKCHLVSLFYRTKYSENVVLITRFRHLDVTRKHILISVTNKVWRTPNLPVWENYPVDRPYPVDNWKSSVFLCLPNEH